MAIGDGALPPVFFVHLIFMCIRVMRHETGVIDVCLSLQAYSSFVGVIHLFLDNV